MSKYFTEDHEWVLVEGSVATVGITEHAAEQLGEVVFVELQDPDTEFDKGEELGVVESVKAASDIYAPISGKVLENNPSVVDGPESLGKDPEGEGWLYKISISDNSELDDLLDEAAYKGLIE